MSSEIIASKAPAEAAAAGDPGASSEGHLRLPSSDAHLPTMPPGDQLQETKLRDELEKMLALAETLQTQCDRLSIRIEGLSFCSIALLFLSLGFGLYLVLSLRRFETVYALASLLLTAIAGLGYIQTGAKRRLSRDRRALLSIVDLLRETEAAFMYQGLLSTFEIAQFRIRMSRFDIGAPSIRTGRITSTEAS